MLLCIVEYVHPSFPSRVSRRFEGVAKYLVVTTDKTPILTVRRHDTPQSSLPAFRSSLARVAQCLTGKTTSGDFLCAA